MNTTAIKACLRRHATIHGICTALAAALVMACLWLMLRPVEQTWSAADNSLTTATGLAVAAAVVAATAGRKGMSFSFIDLAVVVWMTYTVVHSVCVTTFPCATVCLRAAQAVALYGALRVVFSATPYGGRLTAAAITAWAVAEAAVGMHQLYTGTSRHYMCAVTGTFFNPGPYAISLTMGLAVLLMITADYERRAHKIATGSAITAAILASMLAFTGSRTAILVAVVIALYVFRHRLRGWWLWVAAAATATAAALYFAKQGSADGRLVIYWLSLRSIGAHLITGTGIGSFLHSYSSEMSAHGTALPGWALSATNVPDYAFNDLLHIAVEQGLIGTVSTITLTTGVTLSLWRHSRMLAVCIMSLLASSMLSYPFELPPFQTAFTLLAAHAATESANSGDSSSIWCHVRAAVTVAAAAALCLLSVPAIRQRVDAERQYSRFAGYGYKTFLFDYYRLLPLLDSDPHFLFGFAKNLRLYGRYNDSNDILRRGQLVSADPMFLVLQGNNYKDLGALHEAETAYCQAFRAMPNRVYPLYRLMLLYRDSGDNTKARHMARRILDFNIKVESPATDSIKDTARRLLAAATTQHRNQDTAPTFKRRQPTAYGQKATDL